MGKNYIWWNKQKLPRKCVYINRKKAVIKLLSGCNRIHVAKPKCWESLESTSRGHHVDVMTREKRILGLMAGQFGGSENLEN